MKTIASPRRRSTDSTRPFATVAGDFRTRALAAGAANTDTDMSNSRHDMSLRHPTFGARPRSRDLQAHGVPNVEMSTKHEVLMGIGAAGNGIVCVAAPR